MRPRFINGFIRNEPAIPAVSELSRRFPACLARFILVLHPDSQFVDFCVAEFAKVKDVFVAVVDEARAVNRFEMTDGQVL